MRALSKQQAFEFYNSNFNEWDLKTITNFLSYELFEKTLKDQQLRKKKSSPHASWMQIFLMDSATDNLAEYSSLNEYKTSRFLKMQGSHLSGSIQRDS